MASPECSECETILCGSNPRRWKPSLAAWTQRRETMLVLVTFLGNVPVTEKYEQMGVLGSVL